jgi:hypothetical protein
MPTNVCTPVFEQSDQITCKAAGTIRGKRFVVVGATPTGGMFGTENINIVEVSVAGSRPLGVARYDGISGDQIDVIRGNEIVPCVAGAAITANTRVTIDSQGRVIPYVAGGTPSVDPFVVGLACEDQATTGNDVVVALYL